MTRLICVVGLVVTFLVMSGGPASAHPLGNFTISHYAGLELRTDGLSIDYVLDLAEIPAFQLRDVIAADPRAACATIAGQLTVTLDGAPLGLATQMGRASYPPGQAGLDTLRLECSFGAPWTVDATTAHAVTFADGSYPDRIGWREITARAEGLAMETSLPATSASARLTAYPQGAYTSSLEARSGVIRVLPTGTAAGPIPSVISPARQGGDPVSALFGGVDIGSLPLLLAVAIATALGAVHAATPGHGKTIMAAYLIGTRRSLRDAISLGLVVAVAHTTGVLILALVVLGSTQVFPAERAYPILSALSAIVVVALGLGMLRRELAHRAAHDHARGHSHAPQVGTTSLVALGLAGGLVPSASALVLLLGALAAHRPALGVLLVGAFGIGMAVTLVAAGIALVAAGRALVRVPVASRLAAFAPLLAAVAVLTVGLGLTAQSLAALL